MATQLDVQNKFGMLLFGKSNHVCVCFFFPDSLQYFFFHFNNNVWNTKVTIVTSLPLSHLEMCNVHHISFFVQRATSQISFARQA